MNKLKKSAFTTAIVFLLSLSMATTVFASRQSEFVLLTCDNVTL